MKSKFYMAAAFVVLGIYAVTLVQAIAISAPYWEGNPLRLTPGQEQIVTFSMQNVVGDGDVTVRVKIIQGESIASLVESKTEYSVPLGATNVPVQLRVKIPEGSGLSDTQRVIVSFNTVTSGDSGGAALGIGIDKTFDVMVGAPDSTDLESNKPAFNLNLNASQIALGLTVVALVVAAIIWFVAIRKDKKVKKK